MAQMRRWLPFAVATLATVLLAGGFGFAVDHVAAPHRQPAPQLRTVSAATLSRLGITLSAPAEPLYCGAAGAVVSHGWLSSGAAGCAISRNAAEGAARQGSGTTRVVESVLALVDSSRVSTLGHDLLAWVAVTQQTRSSCMQGLGGYQVCVGGRGGFTSSQLVFVDAHSAQVVTQLRLTTPGGIRLGPAFPQSGTVVPAGG
ncbi:MAG TPA: hypothetical protein VE953_18450 [Terriglobales bacterium]|nr:hypothetical protein [Terriglobales bacterium]